MVNKYVITGPASSGKSSLINIAFEKSYYTIPEVAEYIINREQKKKKKKKEYSPILPWLDLYNFQIEVIKQQNLWENEIPNFINNAILDRGIIDEIGFCRGVKIQIPKELLMIAEKTNYKKVFYLKPLKNYKKSKIKREEKEQSIRINKEIQKAYVEFGYNLIEVPSLPIEKRLEFILEKF